MLANDEQLRREYTMAAYDAAAQKHCLVRQLVDHIEVEFVALDGINQ